MKVMKHLKGRPRIAKLGVVAAIAALGMVAVPSASAYPTHYSRSASCGPGAMIASPPPYAVKEYYYWASSGVKLIHWSYFNNNGSSTVCQIT
jgi:hypothetical protein